MIPDVLYLICMSDEPKPEAVVGAFIRNQSGDILLVKSHKWPGVWVVGGGHIEYGETIASAIKREIIEEYGLHTEFIRVIKVVEFINSPYCSKRDRHFIALQCECLALHPDEIKLDHDELQDYQWFTLEAASKLENIVPETVQTIKEMYEVEHAKAK
ncbi:MAG: hypothetical protein UX38_C0007G0002 [Microgenomates group bacterium GW2011_GWC1_46_16]|uniref:Nudix hydrolase domain-containing protein n=2 Tax=Candidatus Collieribacteriota TaxID=1752725 RepID=A0A1F5FXY2_9BACT|nr:MAG: hypothetical protein UX32_C0008G0003 [Microgenomates group bacterium GW2011_GWF1_46_12]KKU26265.1 MAG: hypothetical protein UX38_C0007G0002 [Microgenomates group bacterium GW2011_GWC1_46_16]KKU27632.1 MAG: hypothetical protein UX40_C0009G0002 [Microgenomates group bacterium GW2011_GWF2_46_18]KKU43649.1 MAG: hypothetical protein UX59_C0012G0002 [Microgenomates group bacterium GW2011_GWA1_46_7]KKU45353.1 MAG: hypothetical protein UX63_C0007G0003 [Microgenomates group bacterium GW2011_GWB1